MMDKLIIKCAILILAAIICANISMMANVYNFVDGVAVVSKSIGGKSTYSIINYQGDLLIPFLEYDWIGNSSNGMHVCKKNGKFGYLDNKGNLVIPVKYDFARAFNGNYALVREGDSENGQYFTIDKKGNTVHTFSNDIDLGPEFNLQKIAVNEGFALFALKKGTENRHNKWYIISHRGDRITDDIYDNPFQYDGLDGSQVTNQGLSSTNLLIVWQKGEFDDEGNRVKEATTGAISFPGGKTILPVKFAYINPVGETLSANIGTEDDVFSKDPKKWVRFTLAGKQINLPARYAFHPNIGDPFNTFMPVYSLESKQMGLVDNKLKPISEFKYYRMQDVDNRGFAIGFVGKIDRGDWYESDRYRTEYVDIICPSDHSKDILNISCIYNKYPKFVDYNDGILILKEADKTYSVIDVAARKRLYSLKYFGSVYDRFDHEVTMVLEGELPNRVFKVRNRNGQVIYSD